MHAQIGLEPGDFFGQALGFDLLLPPLGAGFGVVAGGAGRLLSGGGLANRLFVLLQSSVIAGSVPSGSNIRAFNHLLGECGVSMFGSKQLAAQYKKGFPRSLVNSGGLAVGPGWLDRG